MARYRNFFTPARLRSLGVAIILFALAVVFQYYASAYSSRVPSNSVPDLLLGLLPVVNTNFLIVEGALTAIAGTLILLFFFRLEYLIFTLKAMAIFIATRAVFVSVTHIGIYPGQIGPDPTGPFDRLYIGLGLEGGYFFSGHTGSTFLMALIFWNERILRYVYLTACVALAFGVLLAHVHYSIDVLAAPYMAYGIFTMSKYFFKEDYDLILSYLAGRAA